jgi:adenosylcobinamide-phosphate synthase
VQLTRKELLSGVALDLVFGDPHWLPHPIRGLGWIIQKAEKLWLKFCLPRRVSGALFCLSIVLFAIGVVRFTRFLNIYWMYSLLACRSLDVESSRVIKALEAGNLFEARQSLSLIVGRDTNALDTPEILRASIETVAENLSDGVVAPLFYLAIAGPAGMAAYKAINTLDSMAGYRNDRYREFGWASARLDDIANFIPARITAALIWLCAPAARGRMAPSITITLRDARFQPSPNAGYPEAAVAGALGIRLGGVNFYGGVPSRKPFLGDPLRPLSLRAFRQTRRLLYACTLTAAAIICGILR